MFVKSITTQKILGDISQAVGADLLLLGLVGSRAYGLDHEESDYDYRGIYVGYTSHVLSITKKPKQVLTSKEPNDCVVYEIEKFLTLALKNNPNILEVLFLPEFQYESTLYPDSFKRLVKARRLLLSQRVRDTYSGYAMSQFKRLKTREEDGLEGFKSKVKKRYHKHALHTFRLLQQGTEILRTGDLTVKVPNPEELKEISLLPREELYARVEDEVEKFDRIETDLPPEPNIQYFERWLRDLRLGHHLK